MFSLKTSKSSGCTWYGPCHRGFRPEQRKVPMQTCNFNVKLNQLFAQLRNIEDRWQPPKETVKLRWQGKSCPAHGTRVMPPGCPGSDTGVVKCMSTSQPLICGVIARVKTDGAIHCWLFVFFMVIVQVQQTFDKKNQFFDYLFMQSSRIFDDNDFMSCGIFIVHSHGDLVQLIIIYGQPVFID